MTPVSSVEDSLYKSVYQNQSLKSSLNLETRSVPHVLIDFIFLIHKPTSHGAYTYEESFLLAKFFYLTTIMSATCFILSLFATSFPL